jgi:uncharacterized protein (DUF58 family)
VLAPEIQKKVKEIKILTRRALSALQIGNFSSAKKGSGFEFDQLRDYAFGDDVRTIDWKSSARTGKILVKQYIEERNRVFWLCVDLSSSMSFSTTDLLKQELAANAASILALASGHTQDLVGLILYSDSVELCIPPKKGAAHIEHILSLKKGKSYVFVFSDGQEQASKELLYVMQKRHNMVLFLCNDVQEVHPTVRGMIHTQDLETAVSAQMIFHAKLVRNLLATSHDQLVSSYKQAKVPVVQLYTNHGYMDSMIQFFKQYII